MLRDLRFAIRLFARQRGFVATAVLTIALGIGLSATVFAVADGVLFRSLPYRDPARLVAVYGAQSGRGRRLRSRSRTRSSSTGAPRAPSSRSRGTIPMVSARTSAARRGPRRSGAAP